MGGTAGESFEVFPSLLASTENRPRRLLVFVLAHREIRKRMDTVVAFTQEYSMVSYLSIGKQWLKNLIIDHHVSTN
jgi:hypothetical protein